MPRCAAAYTFESRESPRPYYDIETAIACRSIVIARAGSTVRKVSREERVVKGGRKTCWELGLGRPLSSSQHVDSERRRALS